MGSVSAPDLATLEEEAHALHCTTAGLQNDLLADLPRAGSVCDLGSDKCVSLCPGPMFYRRLICCLTQPTQTLSQWKASVDNGWARHFVHTRLFEFR